MSLKFLQLIVCSLIACVLCAPVAQDESKRSAAPEVQTCGNDQPASSEVNCVYDGPKPSALNISCTALLLFTDALNTCHHSQVCAVRTYSLDMYYVCEPWNGYACIIKCVHVCAWCLCDCH